VSGGVHLSTAPTARTLGGLPRAGAAWLALVGAGAAASAAALATAYPGDIDRLTLALLLVAGGVAQARATHVPGNQVFHTGLVFTLAAALLLPPAGVVLVCLAQHLPEWLRQRYPWYIQAFNVANVTVDALVAWAVYHALVAEGSPPDEPARVVAAIVAGGAYVLTNHALLAVVLRLARARSLRESGLFGAESLVTDFVLAAVGIVVALLADLDPWLAPVAVVPLVLIHRSLVVPVLREQARRDPKTELLNVRGLDEAASRELARATRFHRPLSILVVDIDDLRGINGRHGHLVGDAALRTVARVLRDRQREYDICARFGGDEFVVVLPETSTDEVAAIRERLTERLASDGWIAHDGDRVPVRASIGAATLDASDETVRDLIRRADGEMYAAKRRAARSVALA
jgi:diguanylate cyclase (GGDEF)-like protein